MEPISEERQLSIILWANPDLKGKDIGLCNGDGAMPRRASWYESREVSWCGGRVSRSKEVAPLYVWDKDRNWQPNYQWFFTEAVLKLLKERCSVGASLLGRESDAWWIERWGDRTLGMNIDPIAALAEYVEDREAQ